jgi:uncharacterized caspase-like protein
MVEVSYTGRQNTRPNLWILSIGVNRYADSAIPSLNYAVNDAKGIIDAFKTQEGKLYGKVNSLLIADGAQLAPTAENIRDNLAYLRQAGPMDVVVLFVSGHGVNDEAGNFLFLPQDAAFTPDGLTRQSRVIANNELLAVLDRAGQKLVFIDSCYSGGIAGKRVKAVDSSRLVGDLKDALPAIFTSSRGNEISREWPQFGYGLFTHALMQGIKGAADANKDGKIQIEELNEYVLKTVSGLNGAQHPYLWAPPGYADFTVATTGK